MKSTFLVSIVRDEATGRLSLGHYDPEGLSTEMPDGTELALPSRDATGEGVTPVGPMVRMALALANASAGL